MVLHRETKCEVWCIIEHKASEKIVEEFDAEPLEGSIRTTQKKHACFPWSHTHVYFPAVAPPLANAGSMGANPERAIPPATPATDLTVFWNTSLREAGADCCDTIPDDDCC